MATWRVGSCGPGLCFLLPQVALQAVFHPTKQSEGVGVMEREGGSRGRVGVEEIWEWVDRVCGEKAGMGGRDRRMKGGRESHIVLF